MSSRVRVHYRVCADAASIEARALAIAIEQSVEMPLEAVRSPAVLSDIVGQVASIEDRGDGAFDVHIDLAAAAIGEDAGQLINMLFGNTSLHDDVALVDFSAAEAFLASFPGPGQGIDGLRRRTGACDRALTCSALKPQGMGSRELAKLAFELSLGGLDFIKDDHGLANQSYSPFAERVRACAAAVRKAAETSGRLAQYAPSLCGSYEEMSRQLEIARTEGLTAVLIAPMISGLSNFCALRRANPDFAFLTHPSMIGAARVSPILFAKLYRLFGADASIFPNYGGRFGYSLDLCRAISSALLDPWGGLAPCAPTPAGGMTPLRVAEILHCYGKDAMLLIGGALLSSPDIAAETGAFVQAVAHYDYRRASGETLAPKSPERDRR